jgi:putative membrane protein
MKKILLTLSVFIFGLVPLASSAQGMMSFFNSSIDTASISSQQQEELEGKKLSANLNNKTIACAAITDADFEKIGEYFMGQSLNDTARHIYMNEMMKRMMGEAGEEQAHIAMGKRFSGCDLSAAFPTQDTGFWPMMGMMGGWWSQNIQSNNNYSNYPMMGNFSNNPMGWGFGFFGSIFMLVLWALIIAGIVTLVKWLMHPHSLQNGNALEILKARYAKGEISKKEYEQKKKDLK